MRIFILGIGDFFKSGNLYPENSGFFLNWFFFPELLDFLKSDNFYPRGSGIFENLRIFIPGIWVSKWDLGFF